MRIVFMGTPQFAVPSLEACARDHELVAVYTRPDAASGRGGTLRATPVKQAAQQLDAPVFEPVSLRNPAVQAMLSGLQPDVIVVAAYGLILPAEVLSIPHFGCVNVHASLLPRWRGAAPIERAILAGDEVTGVSIMRMEEGLDTGPYCVQQPVMIAEKDAEELTEELAYVGSQALTTALDCISRDTCEWVVQDETLVTYAAKITKDEMLLSPDLSARENLRRVRASSRRAPARLNAGEHALTVVDASFDPASLAPGALALVGEPVLGTVDGSLRLHVVKPEGRSQMASADWVRGAHIEPTQTWSAP